MRYQRGPMFKNRIVGHGNEAPDQLLANPFNWKIHTELQQDQTEIVLETVGWVQSVIKNNRTGHMVDGHMRVMLALRRDEETVPVTYIDVSEAEERLILLTLDPLAALAAQDKEKLPLLKEDVITDALAPELDLDQILKKEKKRTKGLTHEVKECTCCHKACKPGCGCYRDEEIASGQAESADEPEPARYPKRTKTAR